jgi:hypothetical protein
VNAGWTAIETGDFNGNGKADILFQKAGTGQVKIWEMDGTTLAHSSTVGSTSVNSGWTAIGTGDFNGDSKSDIIFQNTGTGQVKIWLMNGTTKLFGGAVGTSTGTAWHVIATGG